MITIDHESCNACGICVRICHEYCIDTEGESIKIDQRFCSTCCQCIAVCPQQALLWKGIKPSRFNNEFLPDSRQLDELFRERRTNRHFKNKKVNREILEEVVNYAVYAPTHSFQVRALIIDDDNLIKEIDRIIYKFSARIYRLFYSTPLMPYIVKTFTPNRETEYLKAKPKLVESLKRNRNFKSIPPAIVMIISDPRIPLMLESAQYALYNIDLFSRTKGLGCRNLVGNQMFLNRSRYARKLLGLEKHEKIFGTMAIGYPSIKFRNKVNGRKIEIQWNN